MRKPPTRQLSACFLPSVDHCVDIACVAISYFRLGDTLPEAFRMWAERAAYPGTVTTISALLDRYTLEDVPAKAPKTATENVKQIARLRLVFGAMDISDLEPQRVYQYADKRTAKTTGKRLIYEWTPELLQVVEDVKSV